MCRATFCVSHIFPVCVCRVLSVPPTFHYSSIKSIGTENYMNHSITKSFEIKIATSKIMDFYGSDNPMNNNNKKLYYFLLCFAHIMSLEIGNVDTYIYTYKCSISLYFGNSIRSCEKISLKCMLQIMSQEERKETHQTNNFGWVQKSKRRKKVFEFTFKKKVQSFRLNNKVFINACIISDMNHTIA
jgi:hypothetical protein